MWAGVDVGRRCPSTRTHWIGLCPVAHHRRARSRCGATGGPCRIMGAGRRTVDARPPSAPVARGLVKRRRVVPRRSLRGSTFPTRRRRVLARIRRRTSRPPPRPSAARPPASSPGDLRKRPCSCSTAGQYLSVDQPVKPTTRGGAPNLFHAAATVAERRERRERRGGHMTASAHLLIALMSGCRGLGGRGQISARTTRRRSATDLQTLKSGVHC